MNFKKNIFAILAIFCILLSVCAVSAVDFDDGYIDYDDGYIDYDDGYIDYDDDVPYYLANQTQLEPGAGLPLENQTGPSNQTNHTNTTTHNVTNTTVTKVPQPVTPVSHALHATGNPILALLLVGMVLGAVHIFKRK